MKQAYIPFIKIHIQHNYFGENNAKGLKWIAGVGVKKSMANHGLYFKEQNGVLTIFASIQDSKQDSLENFINKMSELDLNHIFHLTVLETSFFQYTDLPEYQSGESFFSFSIGSSSLSSQDSLNKLKLTEGDVADSRDLKPLESKLLSDLNDRIQGLGSVILNFKAINGNYSAEIEVEHPVRFIPINLPEGSYQVKIDGKELNKNSTYYLGYQPSQVSTLGGLEINWQEVAKIALDKGKIKEELPLKASLQFETKMIPYQYRIIDKYSSLESAPEIEVISNEGFTDLKFELISSDSAEYIFESNISIPLKDTSLVSFQLKGGESANEMAELADPDSLNQQNGRILINKLPLASPNHLAQNKKGGLCANIIVYI